MERDANGKALVELGPQDGAIVVRRNAEGQLSVKCVWPAGMDMTKPPIDNPPAALALAFGTQAITSLFGREGDEPETPSIEAPPSKPLIIGG